MLRIQDMFSILIFKRRKIFLKRRKYQTAKKGSSFTTNVFYLLKIDIIEDLHPYKIQNCNLMDQNSFINNL